MKTINFKLITTLIVLTFQSVTLFAQNDIWSFAPNYRQNPGGGIISLPTNNDYQGESAEVCHNAMIDEQGDLQFFIVDEKIYDAEGFLIDEMQVVRDNIGGFPNDHKIKGGSEIVIVPDPENCNRYYIISLGSNDFFGSQSNILPYYTILDMQAQNINYSNRTGALEQLPNSNEINSGNAFPIDEITPNYYDETTVNQTFNLIGASPLTENNEHFILISNGESIFRYIINANGMSYDGVVLNFEDYIEFGGRYKGKQANGELEIIKYNDGYRVSVPFYFIDDVNDFRGTEVLTFDLNSTLSLIPSSAKSIEYTVASGEDSPDRVGIKGLELSPNGRYLFIMHNIVDQYNRPFEYVDLQDPGLTRNPLIVPLANSYQHSQLEHYDGRIYMVDDSRLASIATDADPSIPPNVNTFNTTPIDYSFNFQGNSTELTEKKTYHLSHQIDNYNYTDQFFISEACCARNISYSDTDIEINGSESWTPGTGNNPFGSNNGEVFLDGDLVIPAGTNVQITDMTFHFTPGSKLIIERGNNQNSGARLTLIETTLTADERCFTDAMWNGVQVQGYTNQNQYPLGSTKQGWFRMYNDSRIEHAYIGAATTIYESQSTYPFEPGNADFSATGGIVEVSNSTFFNNRQDILFYSYEAQNGQDNRSRATNTRFITNGELNDPSAYPYGHVTILGNVGINLFGNDYINETPNLYAFNQQGSGVVSINSQIKVKARCQNIIPIGGQCNNFDRSEFRNLYYGVASLSSVSGRKTTIDRSLFINNYFGAYLGNDDFSEVTRNDFEVYRSIAPNESFKTYGLYLYGCDGYQVEGNSFTEFDDPLISKPGNTYGVVVNNSGTGDNEIYRNEFFNIKVGGQSQNINSETYDPNLPYPNNVGLRWKCNTFTEDIYVADLAVTSGRIAYQQGYCSSPSTDPLIAVQSPAGNRFSMSTFTQQNDIAANTGVLSFTYSHHADVVTTPNNYNTDVVSPQSCFNEFNEVYFDEDKSCPSEIIDLNPTIGVIPLLPLFRSQLDSIKEVILSKEELIDDNATNFLVGVIETEDDGTVKNTLLDVSPYLSDEVLIAYLNSNPPSGHLKQVLLANSSLSDDVLLAMENINIPNGVKNQINNAQVGDSERDQLINSITYDKNERSLLLNKTIRLVLEDTIMPGRLDTVAVLLKEESEQRRKEQLCDVYLCDRDTTRFNDTRADIESEYGQTNFVRMADMNKLLSRETGAYTTDTLKTNSSLRQEVEDIAADQNDRINAVRAEALLAFFRDSLFQPIVEPLFLDGGNKMMVNDNNEEVQKLREMKLFPNPSKGSVVTVEIHGEAYDKPTIEIVDLTGKSVAHFKFKDQNKVKISTADYRAGVYFVKLNDNGRFIETQKLIIQ